MKISNYEACISIPEYVVGKLYLGSPLPHTTTPHSFEISVMGAIEKRLNEREAAHRQKVRDYYEKHEIFSIFAELQKELILHKPANSLEFMARQLEVKPGLRVIIAGPPAGGKGTQCERIKETFGLVHISTGDLLREEVSKGSELGMEAKSYMESGGLVPDSVVIGMVKEKLATRECREAGWLLDGFPRTRLQAQALISSGILPDKVVVLDVPDEVIVERVSGRRMDPKSGKIYHTTFNPPPEGVEVKQRSDDTAEAILPRLKTYYRNITPILSCYAAVTVHVDGNRPTDTVWNEVHRLLVAKPLALGPRVNPIRCILHAGNDAVAKEQADLLQRKYKCQNGGALDLSGAAANVAEVAAQLTDKSFVKDGWILKCPLSAHLAEQIRNHQEISATRVILLADDISDATVEGLASWYGKVALVISANQSAQTIHEQIVAFVDGESPVA